MHVHQQLTHAVHKVVEMHEGSECLLLVVAALQEEALEMVEQARQLVDKNETSEEQLELSKTPSQIGRRVIW